MAKREKLNEPKNNYFINGPRSYKFVSTGCTLLDCPLGGGYALGRIANIVGDKSTAKTALACEAITNFVMTYPKGRAAYRETEAAFDRNYARAMGMPVDKVDFGDPEKPLNTVEDFERDLSKFVTAQAGKEGIYVLDSLDALSDEAEMKLEVGEGTYGASKAKSLSRMFRKLTRQLEQSHVLLIVISQVRESIGIMFGEKHRRSGGKALDFYASQILWLAVIKQLKKTIKGVERPYGVIIRANVKKNKVGIAFRQCDFPFIFGYGVDDVMAGAEWLKSVNRLDAIELKESQYKAYITNMGKLDDVEYQEERHTISNAVKQVWGEIETCFLPGRSKYNL